VFSHALVGSTLVACGLRPRWGLVALGGALAVLPDLDVVGLGVGWGLDHPLGHRGLSHSLAAAATLATIATTAVRGTSRGGTAAVREPAPAAWRIWLLLFVASASHGVLDALTNGGRGVAFFAPFSAARWHFGVRPIEVSPIGVREFFTARGIEVMANELAWIWLPSALVLALAWLLGRFSDRGTPAARAPDPRPPGA
jgi:inner membrane protein